MTSRRPKPRAVTIVVGVTHPEAWAHLEWCQDGIARPTFGPDEEPELFAAALRLARPGDMRAGHVTLRVEHGRRPSVAQRQPLAFLDGGDAVAVGTEQGPAGAGRLRTLGLSPLAAAGDPAAARRTLIGEALRALHEERSAARVAERWVQAQTHVNRRFWEEVIPDILAAAASTIARGLPGEYNEDEDRQERYDLDANHPGLLDRAAAYPPDPEPWWILVDLHDAADQALLGDAPEGYEPNRLAELVAEAKARYDGIDPSWELGVRESEDGLGRPAWLEPIRYDTPPNRELGYADFEKWRQPWGEMRKQAAGTDPDPALAVPGEALTRPCRHCDGRDPVCSFCAGSIWAPDRPRAARATAYLLSDVLEAIYPGRVFDSDDDEFGFRQEWCGHFTNSDPFDSARGGDPPGWDWVSGRAALLLAPNLLRDAEELRHAAHGIAGSKEVDPRFYPVTCRWCGGSGFVSDSWYDGYDCAKTVVAVPNGRADQAEYGRRLALDLAVDVEAEHPGLAADLVRLAAGLAAWRRLLLGAGGHPVAVLARRQDEAGEHVCDDPTVLACLQPSAGLWGPEYVSISYGMRSRYESEDQVDRGGDAWAEFVETLRDRVPHGGPSDIMGAANWLTDTDRQRFASFLPQEAGGSLPALEYGYPLI